MTTDKFQITAFDRRNKKRYLLANIDFELEEAIVKIPSKYSAFSDDTETIPFDDLRIELTAGNDLEDLGYEKERGYKLNYIEWLRVKHKIFNDKELAHYLNESDIENPAVDLFNEYVSYFMEIEK